MKKTEEIFNNYIESYKAIEALCYKIWRYVYENYLDFLEYGKYSSFDEWELEDNHLSIKYYRTCYDLVDTAWLEDIPLDVIYNDTWKEFIDEHYNKIKAKEEAKKVVREAKEKTKRQKLYEKLKQEFEDGK